MTEAESSYAGLPQRRVAFACAEPCALANPCSCGSLERRTYMTPEVWAAYLGVTRGEFLRQLADARFVTVLS